MRSSLRRSRACCLAGFVVLVAAMPATAGSESDPEIRDAAGDANYLNHQGTDAPPLSDQGPDTRPASLDGADLVAAWYETTYETVVDRDQSGAAIRVRHVPVGLRVRIKTTGPAAPSFGPTISYGLWVTVEGCSLIFRMYARGPLSDPSDPPQRAELRTRRADCLEGPKTYTEGISLSFEGNVATLDFPFHALAPESGGLLAPGLTIGPDIDGNGSQVTSVHRAPNGLLIGGPFIDMAPPTRAFVVGSDVPPDVDCATTPDHPACLM